MSGTPITIEVKNKDDKEEIWSKMREAMENLTKDFYPKSIIEWRMGYIHGESCAVDCIEHLSPRWFTRKRYYFKSKRSAERFLSKEVSERSSDG